MTRILARLAGALALLLWAPMALAQAPEASAVRGASISDLAGLDPAAVRGRLASVPADWPVQPAFQMATPEGLLTFITAYDLMMDPVLAQRMTVFRTAGDLVDSSSYLECRETLIRNGGSPEAAALVVLMFRNGQLETAFQPIEAASPPAPNSSDRKAALAYVRRPVSSPFIGHFGELPLEDGLGFLARWTRTELSPRDRLSAACSPPAPLPVHAPSPRQGLSASDWQGLALVPFAVTLPAENRQRVAARQQGGALLASLHVAEMLGSAPEKFAANRPGVRAYPAKQGDYAVLSIDLGGYPGRNLTNFNDAALVGVRSGRIEWMSPPSSIFGPNAALLCLDAQGVPNTPRPGCSGWGHFSP